MQMKVNGMKVETNQDGQPIRRVVTVSVQEREYLLARISDILPASANIPFRFEQWFQSLSKRFLNHEGYLKLSELTVNASMFERLDALLDCALESLPKDRFPEIGSMYTLGNKSGKQPFRVIEQTLRSADYSVVEGLAFYRGWLTTRNLGKEAIRKESLASESERRKTANLAYYEKRKQLKMDLGLAPTENEKKAGKLEKELLALDQSRGEMEFEIARLQGKLAEVNETIESKQFELVTLKGE